MKMSARYLVNVSVVVVVNVSDVESVMRCGIVVSGMKWMGRLGEEIVNERGVHTLILALRLLPLGPYKFWSSAISMVPRRTV